MSKKKKRYNPNNKDFNKRNNNMEQQENKEENPNLDIEDTDNTDKVAEEADKTDSKSDNTDSKTNDTDNKVEKNEDEKSTTEDLQKKLDELNDKYLRLAAEYDNYRKRTVKEKMDLTKYAGEDVLKGILPVVDNVERAVKSLESASDMEAVKQGVTLIYNSFKDFLEKRGLKEIEAINLPLDTDVHEAITKFPAPTPELKGKIIDVVEKGYFLGEKVIRFAKVVVGE